MASASREIRRKRRVKRNLTLMTRVARQSAIGHARAQATLFAILSKFGGEIEVSEVELTSGASLIQTAAFRVERKNPDDPTDTTHIVRIVTKDEIQTASAPAFVADPEITDEDLPAEDTVVEGVEDVAAPNVIAETEV